MTNTFSSDENPKTKVLVMHQCPVADLLLQDSVKGTGFDLIVASNLEGVFETLLHEKDIKIMLIGNRFGQESTPGMGDEYIPRMLDMVQIPYARVTAAPNEISEEFKGQFVLDLNDTDMISQLPVLLQQALS